MVTTKRDSRTTKVLSLWKAPRHGLIYHFSGDGKWLLECSRTGSNRLIDARTGQSSKPLMISRDWVHSASFSPDGRMLALMDVKDSVRLWDTTACKPIGPYLQHPGRIHHLQFSPDSREFMMFGIDNFVYRWAVPDEWSDAPQHIHAWLEYRTRSLYRKQNHIQPLGTSELQSRYEHLEKLGSPTLPVFP